MTLTYEKTRQISTSEVMSFESYPQWRRQDLVRGAQNYMKLFVAHKMTPNNALNKAQL